ncbi:hypothetical protein JTE90_005586 [Oedothorax gibbosus]|uniref:G-protein coupled receptors family 1 profile domain-containing protein n=1 Tax=Oedothorax gibbosus TaxID=931172 RepID=A0AAV6VB89_9ARAC|nr:hypothetical protein JTE90_005586 [Oedothorax gibbosus]
MLVANATLVSVRVSLVLGSSAVSTLGNLFVLVIFSRSVGGGVRHRIVDIILAALALTALVRALLLGPIQATCFITGEWSFGDSMCQLQAFTEAALRNTFIWYLSLLSLERYTKHVLPHEYLLTFSPLTVNVILPGILLVVVVQVTGPLYGWGKYEYLEECGLCGSATPSRFGCVYGAFLALCLGAPPLAVAGVCGLRLAARLGALPKRRLPAANSRLLCAAPREMPSVVALLLAAATLSAPRSALDAAAACAPAPLFAAYLLDGLAAVLLPALTLALHPGARALLLRRAPVPEVVL